MWKPSRNSQRGHRVLQWQCQWQRVPTALRDWLCRAAVADLLPWQLDWQPVLRSLVVVPDYIISLFFTHLAGIGCLVPGVFADRG